MTKIDAAYRITQEQDGAWMDGHCAGFNGWAYKDLPGVLGCAYDRGYWHGRKAREQVIAK